MSLLNTNSMGNACTAFECVYGGQFSHMGSGWSQFVPALGITGLLGCNHEHAVGLQRVLELEFAVKDVPGYSYVTGAARSLVYLRGTNPGRRGFTTVERPSAVRCG